MKITGELLKSERTRKNLTVQDVAFALKLSSKIITSIEAGQIEELPAKTFIRGFVKSYAQYLKMDSDQVMRQFQEEMGSTHPHPQPKPPVLNSPANSEDVTAGRGAKRTNTEQTKVLNESKSNRSFYYIGVAVILVILIVATNRFVERYQKESVLNPQDISKIQPLNPEQTLAPTSTPSASATVAAPDSSSVAASAPSTDSTEAKIDSKPAVATQESPTAATTAVTSSSQPAALMATSTPPAVATTDTEDGFEASSGKPVELILEARKDTEIMYARGNTKTFSKIKLSAKQVQVIRSTTGLHLKSEDGGAFHLVVNGVDKGVPGANNKPVKLSF